MSPSAAFAAVCCLLALTACQDDLINSGTTVGYKKCLDDGKAQNIADYVVKNFCIKKHEKTISVKTSLQARYLPSYDISKTPLVKNGYYFTSEVKNDSYDTVITSFSITIQRNDSNIVQKKASDQVWIEPGNTGHIVFDANELLYKPKDDAEIDPDKKTKWIWYVSDIKGIKIRI